MAYNSAQSFHNQLCDESKQQGEMRRGVRKKDVSLSVLVPARKTKANLQDIMERLGKKPHSFGSIYTVPLVEKKPSFLTTYQNAAKSRFGGRFPFSSDRCGLRKFANMHKKTRKGVKN
jgi:hypothetical protein